MSQGTQGSLIARFPPSWGLKKTNIKNTLSYTHIQFHKDEKAPKCVEQKVFPCPRHTPNKPLFQRQVHPFGVGTYMRVVADASIVSSVFYLSGSGSVLTFILLLFSQSSNGQTMHVITCDSPV